MERPLAGISVLEASRGVAVRYCGRLFAELGATVLRAAGGDDRTIGYGGEAGERFGRWLDAGKLAGPTPSASDLVLAGQDAEDVSAAASLAAEMAVRPTIVAVTWFHPQGPYARWRGTDEIILALSGVAYGFGERAGPPTLAQGHGPQITAGLTAFNAGLAAFLCNRRPARVEVNVFEAFMCLTETGAMTTRVDGGVSVRLGVNRFVPTYPCSSYRTADGWIGVTALTPAQWAALCEIVGRPLLARDPRFATTYERLMLGDEVDALLAPAFRERTTEAWVRAGEAARVPITAMPAVSDLPDVPHWRQRGSFAAFDDSGLVGPILPFRMRFDGPPPARFEGGGPDAPLAGLRVADFSMGWAGPLCTRTLADLGAEVIKVESESHPDWWRGWEAAQGGDPPPREARHNFFAVNRNKRDVALDLTTGRGLASAKALVAGSDVLVENFAAGVLTKLGLGEEVRRTVNPGLIAVSMPAFGNGGPLSGLRAYGSTVEQASGLPFVNGEAHWPPCLQHVAYGDPIAGLFAAASVLATLAGRHRLGGAEVDLAQVACLFQYGADALIAEQLTKKPLPRTGSRRPRAAPVCVVRGQGEDAWLAVAVDGAAAWQGLCGVLGPNAWADDAELATLDGRQHHARMIERALAAWAARLTPQEAAERLQARGVPAAPVQPTHVLSRDPQLVAAGFWAEMERRFVGRHLMCAPPFAYDGARPALRLPAPILGEHTDDVLASLGGAASQEM